jgi:hypothetical protein
VGYTILKSDEWGGGVGKGRRETYDDEHSQSSTCEYTIYVPEIGNDLFAEGV